MIDVNDPRLTAYVLGELDSGGREEIRAAVESSRELQRAVREIRAAAGELETAFAAELQGANDRPAVADRPATLPVPVGAPLKTGAGGRRMAWVLAASLLIGLLGTALWELRLNSRGSSLAVLWNPGRDRSGIELRGGMEREQDSEERTQRRQNGSSGSTSRENGQNGSAELVGPVRSGALGQSGSGDGSNEETVAKNGLILGRGLGRVEQSVPREIPDSGVLMIAEAENSRPVDNFFGVQGGVRIPGDAGQIAGEGKSGPVTSSAVPGDGRAVPSLRPPLADGLSAGMNAMQIGGSAGLGTPELSLESGERAGEAEGITDERFYYRAFGDVERDRGGAGGDRYDPIVENGFFSPLHEPLSTFSIDVDTASWSKVRTWLVNHRQLPPPGAVRIEEMINYFGYSYAPPTNGDPFSAHQTVAGCPWNPGHKLVRVALKGREIPQDKRPVSNLVFLLDVSGSMNESNKLPLVQRGIRMLVEQLTENDRVAMVVYAGAAGQVLAPTTGDRKAEILAALDRLQAGGSTNGGDGIRLAYQLALDNFITGGVNRVILCTDGDFNVGTTSNDELVALVEEKARRNIYLSVLGFGMGNLNDSMLEQISNRGNGNYAFIDTDREARKVLVEQMSGTLVTIARDVKIQVEFNPARVSAYRLVGYENRILAAQDFNNDQKDAGEIGAGHTVTALYEIVPAGISAGDAADVDGLKYQKNPPAPVAEDSGELLTLKLRFKQPDGDVSQLLTFPLMDSDRQFVDADRDFQFAAAVASFGMLLRKSAYSGSATLDSVLEMAAPAAEGDATGYRSGFLEVVRAVREAASGGD